MEKYVDNAMNRESSDWRDVPLVGKWEEQPDPRYYLTTKGEEEVTKITAGRKNDAGKVRIELFPGEALFAISQVLTKGAAKYTDRGWENGRAWGRDFGALMRHLWAWWQGRGPTNESFVFGDLDPEWKCSHLWHAGACLVILITAEMRGMTEFDDRPTTP